MAERKNRYKMMQWYMTYALIADIALFLLYLLFAGFGIIWLKAITAILAILLSGACLGFLYLTKELLNRRSLWMSTTAAAILLCTLVSLILCFPRPNTYKIPDTTEPAAAVQQIDM